MPDILRVTWPTTRPFSGKFLPRPLGFPKTKRTKFEVPSSSSLEDMFDRMPTILVVTWPKPRPFGGSYLCIRLAFHMWSYGPNLKSLAQKFLRYFRSYVHMSKIIGVTWPRPRPFWGKLFVRPLGFLKTKLCSVPNLKSVSQAVLKICSIVCQKF